MAEARSTRSAAIADVVGYSRIMGDEEEKFAIVRTYREFIEELIAGPERRVVGRAGDTVVAPFASPVAVAVNRIHPDLETRFFDRRKTHDKRS